MIENYGEYPRIAGPATGQVDAAVAPRFAGRATFARLPEIRDVKDYDIALLGLPFDSGTTFRPGARFGPNHVRDSSRLIRPFNVALETTPFTDVQMADAGDVALTPFDAATAVEAMQEAAERLTTGGRRLIAIGGDHTLSLPMLRAAAKQHGPITLVHFDAHLDTVESILGCEVNHGTPFYRASVEGLINKETSAHVGVRGSFYDPSDLANDVQAGFKIFPAHDLAEGRLSDMIASLHERVGDTPVYLSVDIDVLEPGLAPGTGTPELGGLLGRELLAIIRSFLGKNVIGGDVVEVSPAYDHAQITGIAAAHVVYETLSVMAENRRRGLWAPAAADERLSDAVSV
ncbi:agmatinase [Arthrobacter sp. MYb23]|uniref:agmatinase n=1 Tax=unclassified Arthrobacter TaxID=235627 RepID=UPI000CFE0F3A|nr:MULTISPECIES: agmatinase [unclassified Arthrobacter]PRB43091.1 agmatinase [Arthrobacter sp. MYb51]PRB98043.1 agmatinase [Arthrobacter sp. MYb23]